MSVLSQKYGILVVEDDASTRTLISGILTSNGFEVKEAGLAADGFKAVDESIHLVLVDINLPDFDGQNLVTRLRRRYDRNRLKICFASGLSEKETVRKSLAVGGDDYLIKPIDKDLLLQKVTKLLGQSSPQFAWVATNCKGEVLESNILPELRIVRLSEVGVLFKTGTRFKVDSHIKLDSPTLSTTLEFPFGELVQRVVSCERIGRAYFVATEFVGVKESYAQFLRGVAIRGKNVNDPDSKDDKAA